MPPKRVSTSTAPAMTQATIWQLISDGIAAALEALAATMANTENPNGNLRSRETLVAKKRKLQRVHKLKCTEEDKVTFAIGTLTNDALSWWNAYTQPIGIEQANKIAWAELKRLLTNKELALLCPNMVPNSEKLIEVFIGGLPRSIEGNVTALKPQTLEEVITITQRMPPKRVSTSTAPAMTQATIWQLISDGIAAALEALAATMANTENPNGNLRSRETLVAKKRKLQRVHKLSTFLL
nr:hypothetical protein [Tanacetum cinerariifolium]